MGGISAASKRRSGAPEPLAIFASTSSRTSTVTLPAGLTTGMVLIALVGSGENSTTGALTVPAGWTARTAAINFARSKGRLFTRTVDETEGATVTFPASTANGTGVALVAMVGADTADPLRSVATTGRSSNGTTYPLANVTFTVADSVRLAFVVGGWGGNFPFSPPAGMTELLDFTTISTTSNGVSMSLARQLNPPLTTLSGQFTNGTGLYSATWHVDVRQA
jgi:hypothetical protein